MTYTAQFGTELEPVVVNRVEYRGKMEGYSAIRGVRYGHVVNSAVNQVEYIVGKGQWSGASVWWLKRGDLLPSTGVTYTIPDARTTRLDLKVGAKQSFVLARSSICIPPPCVLFQGCILWTSPWSQGWLVGGYGIGFILALYCFVKWLQFMCREEEEPSRMVGGRLMSAAELIQVGGANRPIAVHIW